jgi:hypothetical protein
MLKVSDIKGINTYHYTFILYTQVEFQRKSEVKMVEFQGRMKSFGDVFQGMLFIAHLIIYAINFFLE